MTTAPRASHASPASTLLAALAAISLIGVLVGVAVSYRAPVERKPSQAPRPRAATSAAFALA